MNEQWKKIPDFPGYEISDQGRVRSFYKRIGSKAIITDKPQRIMRPCSDRGYARVFLARPDQPSCMMRIAALVLLVFVGPKPEGLEIHHKDEDKGNNNLDNLEYVTRQANMAAVPPHLFGPSTALCENEVLAIRRARASGMPVKQLAHDYQRNINNIHDICTGRSYPYWGGPRTNGKHRWTTCEIAGMRRRRANGTSLKELAAIYSVHESLISKICTGKRYPDVGGPIIKPWSVFVKT